MESLHMMESHHLALLIEEIHFSYFYKMVALHHMIVFHNIMGFHDIVEAHHIMEVHLQVGRP